MVTKVTSTVMSANAISANNIADNAIVSRHIGDDVILARHIEDSFIPTGTTTALNSIHANTLTAISNVNAVQANVNTVTANVNIVQNNVAGILDGATFTGGVLLGEGQSLGVSNLTPETSSITVGSPANVIIQYDTTTGGGQGGNVIIGQGTGDIDGSATAFRLDVRGTANTGAITATTIALSADGGVQVPNDGNIGSAGATDAMQISSGGIVTFKDDIKLKNDGTIGSAGSAGAITIASDGVVTFVDDIKIKDVGTIGSATTPAAISIAGDGAITIADDLTITGNLTVSGDTVTQDVADLTVEDRIILAAKNASGSPSLDTGLMVSRGAQGNVFIGYDESVNKVVLAHTSSPHTNTSISATSAANLDSRHITAESLVLSGDAGVLVPNDGNIGSAGSTAAIQIASTGRVTMDSGVEIDNITIDGTEIDSTGVLTLDAGGVITLDGTSQQPVSIKNAGTEIMQLGTTGVSTMPAVVLPNADESFSIRGKTTTDGSLIVPQTLAQFNFTKLSQNFQVLSGNIALGTSSAGGTSNITHTAGKGVSLDVGFGVVNTAPEFGTISLGTPANAVIRTHAASGAANIIVGDATATSGFNLDVRGSANVKSLSIDGLDVFANDFATFSRLNANLNVVQDNVAAVAGTSLSPATNTITSVAGANAYGIGAAVTALARTRVFLSGINQLPTTDYVIASSGVMQLTELAANIPAGIPIQINYWN